MRTGATTPKPTKRRPAWRSTMAVLACLLWAGVGCAGRDAPTAPGQSPAFSSGSGSSSLLGTITEAQLKLQEELEKARIAAEQEASKTTYDSLKVVWQQFLDSHPDPDAAPFLICDPHQYVGQVKIIGPEGGNIDFGPHKLVIPAGALSARTVITAEAPTSLTAEVKFSPHGLKFAMAPLLRVSYKHCFAPETFLRERRIAYVSEFYQVLEWPTSKDYPDYDFVAARIWHFSKYAVAY